MPKRNSASQSATRAGRIDKADLELKSLRVLLDGDLVGTLAITDDDLAAFEYDADWLDSGFPISPFSIPLEKKLFIAKRQPLDGMFGIFSDSLPDGWGRLLVDRFLREQGIDPFEISPLGRLAIVGKGGMGALEYEPELPLPIDIDSLTLDELAQECVQIMNTNYSEDLDTLFALGGSSGGARPKIFTKIDGEDWIVKFPSTYDPANIGAQEFRFSTMAAACGIKVPETRLLPSSKHSGYFATKRFDRELCVDQSVKKIHMASVGAILETSHRIPNLDYEQLLRLTLLLTEDVREVERMFRLMVFNVTIGNRDDHAKNFSFLCRDGQWKLSPAYDLTSNQGMNGEHATTVNGKGKNITPNDMILVGQKVGINPNKGKLIVESIDEITKTFSEELPNCSQEL